MARAGQPASPWDYDAEARKLFARLGVGSGRPSTGYDPLNAVYSDHATGGTLYIGNQTAAADRDCLRRHGVALVVNCTDSIPNYFEKDRTLRYIRFDISAWCVGARSTLQSRRVPVQAFAGPLFEAVREVLAAGHSVLVHCLAGAHRAGTTGCALVMELADLDRDAAVAACKMCRPVVDPIGALPTLLDHVAAWRAQRKGGAFARSHGFVAHCGGCGATWELGWDRLGSAACAACGGAGSVGLSGPLWIGPLQDATFIGRMREEAAVLGWDHSGGAAGAGPCVGGLLEALQAEAAEGLGACCVRLVEVGRRAGLPTPPRGALVEELRRRGHAAVATHVDAGAVRTAATFAEVCEAAAALS